MNVYVDKRDTSLGTYLNLYFGSGFIEKSSLPKFLWVEINIGLFLLNSKNVKYPHELKARVI